MEQSSTCLATYGWLAGWLLADWLAGCWLAAAAAAAAAGRLGGWLAVLLNVWRKPDSLTRGWLTFFLLAAWLTAHWLPD